VVVPDKSFCGGRDNYIQGLTTAASILLVSGIGMAVALNEFILAGGVTLLALMIRCSRLSLPFVPDHQSAVVAHVRL
jgi:uncharacterized membrane protein YhiD involved in acid resistance